MEEDVINLFRNYYSEMFNTSSLSAKSEIYATVAYPQSLVATIIEDINSIKYRKDERTN
ncbi:MAG: hypothetical protein NTY07_02885 [Bacteroidia bacterium]|nr:hypothetical protein [Bacteroidia bacterium]